MTAPTVAYRDVRAADLALHLGLPPQPAVARRALALGPWTVELRILSASHQVLVGRGGVVPCSETIACPADGATVAGPLPRRRRHRLAVGTHELTTAVDTLEARALERRVAAVVDALRDDPAGLWVAFPGHDHAITALHAEAGAHGTIAWRSWHSYPQTGELVRTASRVTPAVDQP